MIAASDDRAAKPPGPPCFICQGIDEASRLSTLRREPSGR
jgi:hypothetical protein